MLDDRLAEKKDEFEAYRNRIQNYDNGTQVIEELERKLDTDAEYQLPEPTALMSAKSYKMKFVEPLIKKFKDVISEVFYRYYQALDGYHRLNVTNGNLYRENEKLIKTNDKLAHAKQTIAETYSKPGTDERTAENEYDKVFSQPLNMLCYAGILKDVSETSRHLYIVENREVLEYIARNDVYALRFLQCYIEKVLTDSGLIDVFNDFFENQDSAHFNAMKQAFIDFYHTYTPVKKDYEEKRK